MTTTNSAAFHGCRERAQPLLLTRSSTNRLRSDQVQRLVQFERQLRLVRSREHPGRKVGSTGPFGALALRPGPPRVHLSGTDHMPKPPAAQCAWRSSIHDGTICASHKATQTCIKGLTKGLDDKGPPAEHSKCEYILAKPLPSSVHPVKALAEWRVRHDKCSALLGASFGPPGLCLHMLFEKLDQSEKLMAQLVRPSPVPTTTVVLLRFLTRKDTDTPHAVPGVHHPGSRHVLWSPGSPNSPNTQRHQPRTGPAHLFDTSSRLSACHFATSSHGFHDRRSSFSRNGRLMASVGWPDPEMSDTNTTTTTGPVP